MAKSTILSMTGEPFALDEKLITQSAQTSFTDIDAISISQVLSALEMPARNRQEIYSRYMYMSGDPIIAAALNLHVTQSLGGHETTGDVIFIEAKPNATDAEKKIIEQIQNDLLDMLNQNAYQIAFWGCAFGDAYARIYGEKKHGISHIELSEFYLPAFIQPFELAGKTAGYRINIEQKIHTLTPIQLSRLKMPRMGFVPQYRMQYNYFVQSITQDDVSKHKPVPSNIGGSFLESAEKPFFLLQSALIGLSSGRILDSIRESIIGLNMKDMTKEQQMQFFNFFSGMLKASKKRAADAIEKKSPVLEKIIHLLPVWDEKQLYNVDTGGSLGNQNANAYSVDDVMFYAKLLAGSLGLDLSMLGFSDLLSGGLGDGGFFRVSAQAGQRSRLLRQGLTGWVNHVIDVHCNYKFNGVFQSANRPYEVVFNGATSALERENQETRERKNAAASVALQNFASVKELGFDENAITLFVKDQMGFDEDDAKIYAKSMVLSNNENEEVE